MRSDTNGKMDRFVCTLNDIKVVVDRSYQKPEVINAQASEQAQLMKVHHTMQGNSLLIECFVPSISFSPTNGTNEQAKN